MAFDVCRRVGFGVAQGLGLADGFGEPEAAFHAGEDEVGGAVEDAFETGDRAAGQGLFGEANDRGAAHH
ncbi:hypothetical protein D3C78_1700260 [compost metagenome]